jgi:hypothetical protein
MTFHISYYNRNSSTSLLEVFFHIHVFLYIKSLNFGKHCGIVTFTSTQYFFLFHIYLQSLLKYSFFSILPGAARRYTHYTHLSIFNRENKSWARLLLYKFCSKKIIIFSFFLSSDFSQRIRWLGRVQILNLLRKRSKMVANKI